MNPTANTTETAEEAARPGTAARDRDAAEVTEFVDPLEAAESSGWFAVGVESVPCAWTPDCYRLLVNARDRYALWPADEPVPDDWSVALATPVRHRALNELARHWYDVAPVTFDKIPAGEAA
ncbi:MbtH family NRPS accessory protein [Streptomyces sp. NPDC001941]|uniref:MbtH family NRPS accessory protein n=1 Tax=Streptomyces sp. NPDC001941 TaxID=3154659 RepID=UPI003318A223